MSKKKTTFLLIVIAVAVVIGFKAYANLKRLNSVQEVEHTKIVHKKIHGPLNAPIKIVEYIDFQCPACAAGSKFLKKFMLENPDKISLELKYYPLSSIHRHAFLAARYTECALLQNQFWPLHDLLIERQMQWHKLTDAKPAFDLMVQEIEVDTQQFQICLDDETIDEDILADKQSGREAGIRSTPTYFINDEMIVGMPNLVAKLKELIN